MKKRLFIFIYLFSYVAKAQQNLVPNGGFDNIIKCPNCHINNVSVGDTTINYTYNWYGPNNGSSDLFNTCDTTKCQSNYPTWGVPYNWGGYQYPKDGNSYAGIVIYGSVSNVRQYLETRLYDSLKRNKKYCISFFVSVADTVATYATSRIGCYLSLNSISNHTQYLINASPQIENPFNNFITNKTTWIEIKGLYTANGGEDYITIGNFYDDSNTDTTSLHTGNLSSFGKYIYYYIDDVSLVEYTEAYAGRDTSVCPGKLVMLGSNSLPTYGANYLWSVLKGDSNSLLIYDTTSYEAANPKYTTTYVLQKQQCGMYSYDTVMVHVPGSFYANAGADTAICIGDGATIGINTCNYCTYTWADISAPYSHYPVLTVYPLGPTTYTLSMQDSCTITTSTIQVQIDYCQSPVITAPNIFTPNGDAINDTWQPTVQNPLNLLNYQCTIYDRWGVKVYETQNTSPSERPGGAGWDGHTTGGIPATQGTYFYVITYTDGKTNENKSLKGFLELIN